MSNPLPDYYAILKVPVSASQETIKTAYKNAALDHHPDRNHRDPQSHIRFQYVNDAYSILSDPKKKRNYDAERKTASRLFNPLQSAESADFNPQSDPDQVFGDVFEDLLKEEVGRDSSYFWQPVGGISGAAIGFIVANLPGAVAGYAAGQYLGAVRDKKGKSVLQVFQEMPGDKKTEILAAIAKKLFTAGLGVGSGLGGK